LVRLPISAARQICWSAPSPDESPPIAESNRMVLTELLLR